MFSFRHGIWQLSIKEDNTFNNHGEVIFRGTINTFSPNQLFFPSQLQRDKCKQLYCKQQQITLVTVNPQWNGTWSQLRATIRNSRPGTTLKVCLLLTFFLQRSGNNS